MEALISLLNATFRMATPLIFATTGEVVAEKSGVLNIGLEGQMLLGAFTALVVTYSTGSTPLGILAAAFAAATSTLLITYLGVTRRQNQSVVGIMYNIFIAGLTSFLYRTFYGVSLTPPSVDILQPIRIPLLSDIPLIGDTLFSQNALTYISIVLAIITWYVLSRTILGLKIKAVGDNPRAAQSAGIPVIPTRIWSMFFTGLMAGLGGAFLTIAYAGRFTEGITAGRGYMALAITIFGRWNPLYAVGGALLFGLVDALQMRLQTMDLNIPYQFFVMLPYVVVLISMLFTGKNAPAPKALGEPYEKEGR